MIFCNDINQVITSPLPNSYCQSILQREKGDLNNFLSNGGNKAKKMALFQQKNHRGAKKASDPSPAKKGHQCH